MLTSRKKTLAIFPLEFLAAHWFTSSTCSHTRPRLQQQRCYSQPISDSFTPVTVLLTANQRQLHAGERAANSQSAAAPSAAPPPPLKVGQSATAAELEGPFCNQVSTAKNESIRRCSLCRESAPTSRASPDLCEQLVFVRVCPTGSAIPPWADGSASGLRFRLVASPRKGVVH